MQLTELSDEALLSQLAAISLDGHALTARLVVFLIEIEERRLDLKAACTSMFDYCVRRLGMSDGVAFRRINAARLVKRSPALLARVESGELSLSTLVLLRPHLVHLDDAKAYALASDVAGKSLREVEQLLAASAPQPARFKMQLTATSELRDKLERARDLMSHANPSGDLAVVVERAIDLLLERLEKERLGKTTRPPRQAATTRGRDARGDSRARRAIPRGVRREVFERDGDSCSFVDAEGRRCPSRTRLELDHVAAHALGGLTDATNLRVLCRAHNRLHAEEVFGKEHVARAVDFRRRKSRRLSSASPQPPTATAPVVDLALRGLVNLGFSKTEARRALDDVVRRRHPSIETRPVVDVLRDAIAALT